MTQEYKEDFNNNICRFCERETISDRVRYHYHFTGKYRGPAHCICIINVTQGKSNNIPFLFHNLSNYDTSFRKLVDLKMIQ